MHKGLVTEKNSRDYQSNQICGQDRFTFRGRGEATERKQHKENKFYLWLAYSRDAQLCDDGLRPSRHEPEHDQHDDNKDQQPDVEVREQNPEREDCAEIGNKARSQNGLTHARVAITAFDHYGVDDCHRSGRECDSSDLRLLYWLAEDEL